MTVKYKDCSPLKRASIDATMTLQKLTELRTGKKAPTPDQIREIASQFERVSTKLFNIATETEHDQNTP